MRKLYLFWILFASLVSLGISSCPINPETHEEKLQRLDSEANAEVQRADEHNRNTDDDAKKFVAEIPKEVVKSTPEPVNMFTCKIEDARKKLKEKCLIEKENTSRACLHELTMMTEKAFSKHPDCKTTESGGGVNHEVLMCIMHRESKKDGSGEFVTDDCKSNKVPVKTKSGKIKYVSGGCGIVQMTGDGIETASGSFKNENAKSCLNELQTELGEEKWDINFFDTLPKGKERFLAQSRNAALVLEAAHICKNIMDSNSTTPCENARDYYGHEQKTKEDKKKVKNYCEHVDLCSKDLAGIETKDHKRKAEFAKLQAAWLSEIQSIVPGCDFKEDELAASLRRDRLDFGDHPIYAKDPETGTL